MNIPAYQEYRIHNTEIISELDHLIECLPKEIEHCDFSSYLFDDESMDHAKKRTSDKALQDVMAQGDRNVAAWDENVVKLPTYFATELDRDFEGIVKAHALLGGEECQFWMTGKFWYPKGGYMGWHTNNVFPGYRMYISRARQRGMSTFLYRDPNPPHTILHTKDQDWWVARIFRIDPARPLWHAVYSETDRFSFGCNLLVKNRS